MYHIIGNPTSSSGNSAAIIDQVESILRERNIDFVLNSTNYDGHAVTIAEEITDSESHSNIIVIGGDGTVNEVLNGIRDLSKVDFGYIPSGSGNDLARGLRLPKDPMKCLEIILDPDSYQKVDVGVLQSSDMRRRFLISCGIGFDAEVCHGVAVSPLKKFLNKLKLGRLVYLGIALKNVFFLTRSDFTVTIDDGDPSVEKNILFATVMNHPYEGGGLMFCPKADDSDRFLDLCLIRNITSYNVLYLLPTVFFKQHVHFKKYVEITKAKKFSFATDIKRHLHTDGEPIAVRDNMTVFLEEDQLSIATN